MQSCCFGFGSFSPRGARSKGDQQPDGRVAHNQKLLNHPGCRYKDSRHPCPTRKEDSCVSHRRVFQGVHLGGVNLIGGRISQGVRIPQGVDEQTILNE
jgi:hypothetical protein